MVTMVPDYNQTLPFLVADCVLLGPTGHLDSQVGFNSKDNTVY